MRRAWLLFGFLGAACVVPSFDVEPAMTSNGGSTSGGDGNSSSGGKVGANPPHGGTATAGSGIEPQGGADQQAGGAGNVAGPYRVGYSVFHDSASGTDHAAGSQVDASFALPSGTAPGDFMLVFFGCDHALLITPENLATQGWTLHDQHAEQGEDGQGTYLLYRIADGSELDPIVFSGINDAQYTNGVQGLLSVYRGVDPVKPIKGYETALVDVGTDSTTQIETPTPEISIDQNDCLLIAGLSPDSAIDAPKITTWPDGFVDNQVSVTNPANPYPNGWANIYSAERHLQQAATIPASSFGWQITNGEARYFGALSFILALSPEQ